MYYAAINQYGSATDPGFANTWSVVAFRSRQDRDAYCDTDNQGVVAVSRREASQYSRYCYKVLDASGAEIDYIHPPIAL